MTNPADNFATPRLAAGALFVQGDQVLLVRKTYGDRWDIPGGYVDHGESPAAACERELREELGLTRTVRRLLVHDWAPADPEGDKILYVFDCGESKSTGRNGSRSPISTATSFLGWRGELCRHTARTRPARSCTWSTVNHVRSGVRRRVLARLPGGCPRDCRSGEGFLPNRDLVDSYHDSCTPRH